MGSYCPSEDDIDSVLALCPDVDPEAVRKDLQYVTQNVEVTVNRILDGNLGLNVCVCISDIMICMSSMTCYLYKRRKT
jgi:hypothetical protein